MKTTTQKIALLIAVYTLLFTTNINAQCMNFGSQYPAAPQTTTSPTLSNVATCFYGGDYGRYNVTNGETYTWTTCGDTDFDTQLSLWNTAHTTSYAYNDDACGLQSTITWTATFTGQVDVLVSRFNCNDENTCMTVQWACITCGGGTAPPNDLCSGATNLPCGTTNLAGTTVNSTSVAHGTGCTMSNYGAWYSFIGDGNSTTISASPASGYDIEMSISSGSCASLTNIVCRDAGNPETHTFTTTNGVTYFVYIAHWSSSSSTTGTFTISRTRNSPTPVMGQDCPGAEMVCSNTSFAGNSSGFGTQELNASNQGCLSSGERESSWYYVNIGSNGTLEMTISPVASDDYDWAIWGPFTDLTANANCPPISTPIRCSYAGGSGDTGMSNGATDFSEDAGGDKWVAPLNVVDDEIYILLITNHSISSQPFNLNWGGTAGLDCTPISLPVELTFFTGNKTGNINHLSWETATETNNDYFILEHSTDGFSWNEITKEKGAGNSTKINTYFYDHRDFPLAINYYRLTQVDFDGKRETFEIVSIDNSSDRKLIKTVNMIGQEVNENYKGVVIDYYDDNTVVKRYQK